MEEVEMGLAVPNDENQEEPVVENKEEIEKRRAEKGKGKAVEENVDMEETVSPAFKSCCGVRAVADLSMLIALLEVETPETTESNEKVAEQSVKSVSRGSFASLPRVATGADPLLRLAQDDNTTKFVYSDEEQDEGEDGDDEDDGEEEPATPVPVPVPAPASAPIVEEEEVRSRLHASFARTDC